MINRSLSALALTFSFLLVSSAPALPALAASGDTLPTVHVTVEQSPVFGVTWHWTLLNTDETSFTGNKKTEEVSIPAGSYTFFIDSPKGYVTKLEMYQGSEIVKTSEAPQLSFAYDGTALLRIVVSFKLQYSGQVNVVSTPKGVSFELRGPNQIVLTGTTPQSFSEMPIGLYSTRYLPEGCAATPFRSDELKYEGRVDFSVTLNCDGIKAVVEKQTDSKRYVNTTIDGTVVVLRDVPADSWFATYVNGVVRRGIITGYRNDDGTHGDRFGPEDSVTLAQLAKIAHELSGTDETLVTAPPVNPSAVGWSQAYVASAEAHDWTVFTDSGADVNRSATRGEVLTTLLQALDIPLKWPKGKMFTDVTGRTPNASAIETAAAVGVVSGQSDNSGKLTGAFEPLSSVNRAEMAKIVMQSIEKFKLKVEER